jgi:hypothetical protein
MRRQQHFTAAVMIVAFVLPSLGSVSAELRAADEQQPPKMPADVLQSVDKGIDWIDHHIGWAIVDAQAKDLQFAGVVVAGRARIAREQVRGATDIEKRLGSILDFVVAQQNRDGMICSPRAGNAGMYEHGMACTLLAEALPLLPEGPRRTKVRDALKKGVDFTLAAQAVTKKERFTGGWRYAPRSIDSDISVTTGQVVALHAAAKAGIEVPPAAFAAAAEYVKRSARGGGFTYQPWEGSPGPCRTAMGITALELIGPHGSKEAISGGDYLLPIKLAKDENFLYISAYYRSIAFHRLGGDYARGYEPLRDVLLSMQGKDGSWSMATGQEKEAGVAYCTAMAILALCEPYRAENPATRPAAATEPAPATQPAPTRRSL